MKNSLAIVFAVLALAGQAASCPFCSQEILSKQVVFEGEGAYALLNYKPAVPGHMMIIPKRHVERFEDLTSAEAAEIHAMIARVDRAEQKAFGATGYTLLQKNGAEAGQSVPHIHFHYFPRKTGNSNLWLAFKIFTAHLFDPMSEEELRLERDRLRG